jgi:hypothetical protein
MEELQLSDELLDRVIRHPNELSPGNLIWILKELKRLRSQASRVDAERFANQCDYAADVLHEAWQFLDGELQAKVVMVELMLRSMSYTLKSNE